MTNDGIRPEIADLLNGLDGFPNIPIVVVSFTTCDAQDEDVAWCFVSTDDEEMSEVYNQMYHKPYDEPWRVVPEPDIPPVIDHQLSNILSTQPGVG